MNLIIYYFSQCDKYIFHVFREHLLLLSFRATPSYPVDRAFRRTPSTPFVLEDLVFLHHLCHPVDLVYLYDLCHLSSLASLEHRVNRVSHLSRMYQFFRVFLDDQFFPRVQDLL